MLRYVYLANGQVLDVVNFGPDGPSYDSGKARYRVETLAAGSGLSGPELERYAAGWSNGYVSLLPESAAGTEETDAGADG